MVGEHPVVKREVGSGPEVEDLGYAGPNELVEPVDHVAQRLRLVVEAVGDGVAQGGVLRWVLRSGPAVETQDVQAGLPGAGLRAGEELVDPGGAQPNGRSDLADAQAATVGRDDGPGPLDLGGFVAEPRPAEPSLERDVGLVTGPPAVPAGVQLGGAYHRYSLASWRGQVADGRRVCSAN